MSLRRQASDVNSSTNNGISSELSRHNSMSVVRSKHATTKDRNVDFEFIFTGTYKAKKTKTDAKDGTSTSITAAAGAGADDNTGAHATAAAAVAATAAAGGGAAASAAVAAVSAETEPATFDESGVNVEVGSRIVIPIVTSSSGQKKLLKAIKRVAFLTKDKSMAVVEADTLKKVKEKIGHFWGIIENDWRVISTVQDDVVDPKTGKQHHVYTTTSTAIKLSVHRVHINSNLNLPAPPPTDMKCTEILKLNGDPVTGVSIEEVLAYKHRTLIDTEEKWSAFIAGYPKSVQKLAIEFFCGATYKLEIDESIIADKIKLESLRMEGAQELTGILAHNEYLEHLPRCTIEVLSDVIMRHDCKESSCVVSGALWKMGNLAMYRKCMVDVGLVEKLMDVLTFRERDYTCDDANMAQSTTVKVAGIDDEDVASKFDLSDEFSLLQNLLGLAGVLSTDKLCRRVMLKEQGWLESLFALAATPYRTENLKGESLVVSETRDENRRGRLAANCVANIVIREGAKIEGVLSVRIMELLEHMIAQDEDVEICEAGLDIIGNFVKHLQHVMGKYCSAQLSMKMFNSTMRVLKRILAECETAVRTRTKLSRSKIDRQLQMAAKATWACIINLKQHGAMNELTSEQVSDVLDACVKMDSSRFSDMGSKFLYFALSLLSQDVTQAQHMVDDPQDVANITKMSSYLDRYIFENYPSAAATKAKDNDADRDDEGGDDEAGIDAKTTVANGTRQEAKGDAAENSTDGAGTEALEAGAEMTSSSRAPTPSATKKKRTRADMPDRDRDTVVCCCILSIIANISEHSPHILGGLADSEQRRMLRDIGVFQKCVHLLQRSGRAIQEARSEYGRVNSLFIKVFDLCTCIIKMLATADMRPIMLKEEGGLYEIILDAMLVTETQLSVANLMITLNLLQTFSDGMGAMQHALLRKVPGYVEPETAVDRGDDDATPDADDPKEEVLEHLHARDGNAEGTNAENDSLVSGSERGATSIPAATDDLPSLTGDVDSAPAGTATGGDGTTDGAVVKDSAADGETSTAGKKDEGGENDVDDVTVDTVAEDDIGVTGVQCLLDHLYRCARRWTAKKAKELAAHCPEPVLSKFFCAWCCLIWVALDPESSTYTVPDILRHEMVDIDFTAYWGMFIAKRREELEATHLDDYLRGVVEVLQDIASYHLDCKMNKARLLAVTLLRAFNQSARELAVAVPYAVSGRMEARLAEIVEEEREEVLLRINTINLLIEARDVADVQIDRLVHAIVTSLKSDANIDLQMCAATGLSYLIYSDHEGKRAATVAGTFGAAERAWNLLLTYMNRWRVHVEDSRRGHDGPGESFSLELSDDFSTILRCVLNLSIDDANQITMAHCKGLRNVVGFCIDMKSSSMKTRLTYLDPDVPGMMSSLLHNLASNLKNRTPLYKVELHFTAKTCRKEAGVAAKKKLDISRRKGYISTKQIEAQNVVIRNNSYVRSSNVTTVKAGAKATTKSAMAHTFLEWLESTFPDEMDDSIGLDTHNSGSGNFQKSQSRRKTRSATDEYGRPLSAPLQSRLSNPLKRYFNEPIDPYIAHKSSPWYVPIKDYREDSHDVANNARMSLTLKHPERQLQTSMSFAAKTLSSSMTGDGFDATQYGIDHLDFVRPVTPVSVEPMVMLNNIYGTVDESTLLSMESTMFPSPTSPFRSTTRPATTANHERRRVGTAESDGMNGATDTSGGNFDPKSYRAQSAAATEGAQSKSPAFPTGAANDLGDSTIFIQSMFPDDMRDTSDMPGVVGEYVVNPFEVPSHSSASFDKDINLKVAVEPVQQTSCISFRSLIEGENIHLQEKFELSSSGSASAQKHHHQTQYEQQQQHHTRRRRRRRHFHDVDFLKKKMYTWPHTEGSKVYNELFPKYHMPNGRRAFFYYQCGMLTDAMEASIDKNIVRPDIDMLIAFLNDAYPDGTIFSFGDGPMVASRFFELPPPHCPVPATANVPGDLEDRFGDNIDPDDILIEANLLFRNEERKQFIEPKAPRPVWRIQDSIFAPRPKENDSRNYFDTKKCLSRQFNNSFDLFLKKERVHRFFAQEVRVANKTSATGNEVTVESMTHALKTFFHNQWNQVMSMFYYFCALDELEIFRMKLNCYTIFTDDAGIHDKDDKFSNRSELDTLFIVTNYEEPKAKQDLAGKQDLAVALTVAEFIEILLRIAQAKYIKTKKFTSLMIAVETLFSDCIVENLPERLWVDANTFRANELYREEIDDALKRNESFLRVLFNCYRFRMENGKRPNRMRIDTAFKRLMVDFELVGERLPMRDAVHLAITSRMEVDDIVGKWDKTRSLTFLDFCETMCRVANRLRLPSLDELREHKYTNVWSYYHDMKVQAQFGRSGTGPDIMHYTDDASTFKAKENINLEEEGTVIVGSVQKKTTGVGVAKENDDEKFILANQVHALIDLISRQVLLRYPGDVRRDEHVERFGMERNREIITEATTALKREEKKL